MTSASDKPYLDPRLPSLDKVAKILRRDQKSLAEAREYNKKITAEDCEQYHLAGLKKLARQFFSLAGSGASNPHLVKMLADILKDHKEQSIKEKKIAVMLRHLELLEAKAKALEDVAKSGMPNAQVGEYVRKLFWLETPASNGHQNGQPQKTRLLENRVSS